MFFLQAFLYINVNFIKSFFFSHITQCLCPHFLKSDYNLWHIAQKKSWKKRKKSDFPLQQLYNGEESKKKGM